MKKLFKNKKGFTLMEMLIVVAIIVILVAVSMPVFSSQLVKAKDAANDANVRAAKAVAVAEYLSESKAAGTYKYDAATGKLETSVTEGYGKAVTEDTSKGFEQVGDGQVVQVVIADDGAATVTTSWVAHD